MRPPAAISDRAVAAKPFRSPAPVSESELYARPVAVEEPFDVVEAAGFAFEAELDAELDAFAFALALTLIEASVDEFAIEAARDADELSPFAAADA